MCYLHFVARLNCASQRATPAYAGRAFCGIQIWNFQKNICICQSIKHNGALNQIETFTIKIRKTERERAPRGSRVQLKPFLLLELIFIVFRLCMNAFHISQIQPLAHFERQIEVIAAAATEIVSIAWAA